MAAFRPRLNPLLDPLALAECYAAAGRVQVVDLLDSTSADQLEQALIASDEWLQIVNSGDKLFELSRPVRADFDPQRRAALRAAIDDGARWGFQHCFEAIRVPDDADARAASTRPLDLFAAFLSSEPVRTLLRTITGAPGIDFADAQATRYGAGDFLTAHDDAVAGKGRLAAYVFGLTRQWRPDWGGLLLFHDGDTAISGWSPGFNMLNLFRVPQAHSVSIVAPFAGAPRLSVTGWLRTGAPDIG